MNKREMFQSVGTATSLLLSLGAVAVAYMSYDLAQKADARLQEELAFSRTTCCTQMEVEFENGTPVSLYRDIEAYISNTSLNPVVLVTCYEEGTSTWGLGIAGNTCRGTELVTTDGDPIELPYRLDGGDVIVMRTRDSFPLREDAIDAFPRFSELQPESDFIQFMCENGLSLISIASLQPYSSCLFGQEIEEFTRSWVRFVTSRGNSFQSPDLSQL